LGLSPKFKMAISEMKGGRQETELLRNHQKTENLGTKELWEARASETAKIKGCGEGWVCAAPSKGAAEQHIREQ
jgi:hypothetical protein